MGADQVMLVPGLVPGLRRTSKQIYMPESREDLLLVLATQHFYL